MSVLYLRTWLSDISLGTNNTNKAGGAVAWRSRVAWPRLPTTANVTATVGSVNGLTNGLETGAPVNEWISPPLAAAVTISGTITFNMCGLESNAMANAGFGVVVQRLSNTGAIVSTIVDSVQGTELGTANARRTWTATPTSTAMQKGDRFRIRVYFDDAGGTMVSGYTLTLTYDGTTANTGDSNVDFAETITFVEEPSLLEKYALVSSDLQNSDLFGGAVACSANGSVVVVGAQNEDGAGTNYGAAYVFSGSTYQTQVKLTASDPETNAFFGFAVACSSDASVVVVGAPYLNGAGTDRGAVYVYSGANYATAVKLTPNDPQDSGIFGGAVACSSDGSVIVVGSSGAGNGGTLRGAVYVFSGTNYATQVKLTANDAQDNDGFGNSVACSSDGSVVVVGAPEEDGAGTDRGAVYVCSGANYATQTKLTASDTQDSDLLGYSVACSADGSIVIGGAPTEDGTAGTNQGAVYVWSGVNYATQVKVISSTPLNNIQFGYSVACSSDGSRLVVSAPFERKNFGSGDAGCVHVLEDANYATVMKLRTTNPDLVENENFGYRISCSADARVVVGGAPYSDALGEGSVSGKAYVHQLTNRMYLTNIASDIVDQGASVTELTAWTSRGNG